MSTIDRLQTGTRSSTRTWGDSVEDAILRLEELLPGGADPLARGCDDPRMVEYGGGINNGPAGQVSGGGGGTPHLGQSVDFFSSAGHVVNDAWNFIASQPLEVLVAGFFVILLGLVVLRRAF